MSAGGGTSDPASAAAASQPSIVVLDDVSQYEPLFAAIVTWLEARRERLRTTPLAVVLDIDETALLNKGDRVHRNAFVYAFYRRMLAMDVSVFFVTARVEAFRAHTESQLTRLGYDRYRALFMMPTVDTDPARFKRDTRRALIERGYRILANVGDQWTDMTGGYYDIGIKLPEASAVI